MDKTYRFVVVDNRIYFKSWIENFQYWNELTPLAFRDFLSSYNSMAPYVQSILDKIEELGIFKPQLDISNFKKLQAFIDDLDDYKIEKFKDLQPDFSLIQWK